MKHLNVVLGAVALMSLSACATTGGSIGGLFPAPKILKGNISADRYAAPGGTFSVAVPHAAGSYEYRYMQIKEQFEGQDAYVSFGPAAFDQSVYRLEIARLDPAMTDAVNLDDVAPQFVATYEQQLQAAYGTDLELVVVQAESVSGRPAWHWEFRQVAPAGKHLSNRDAMLEHHAWVIDFEVGIALAWVQIPEESPVRGLNPQEFAASVELR